MPPHAAEPAADFTPLSPLPSPNVIGHSEDYPGGNYNAENLVDGNRLTGSFILGALMTIGIGYYAPCMAMVYALGMSPRTAFPIMMAACAFLQPICGMKFIKEGAYNRKISLIVTLFGSVGVFIAAFIVLNAPSGSDFGHTSSTSRRGAVAVGGLP